MSLNRYAIINTQFPREFVLLQGSGCVWSKCTFCDYHADTSASPYLINRPVLEQVTGEFNTLDVINSGSALELDKETLQHIIQIVQEKNIQNLWFEAHYLYRKQLADFAKNFPSCTVKFRCGVESFDQSLWNAWNKGIAQETKPQDIAQYFQGVCLLICVEGQTKAQILEDIRIAKEYFEYASINVFCHNSTDTKQDKALAHWFSNEIYPQLKNDPKLEILLENTDLGVG